MVARTPGKMAEGIYEDRRRIYIVIRPIITGCAALEKFL